MCQLTKVHRFPHLPLSETCGTVAYTFIYFLGPVTMYCHNVGGLRGGDQKSEGMELYKREHSPVVWRHSISCPEQSQQNCPHVSFCLAYLLNCNKTKVKQWEVIHCSAATQQTVTSVESQLFWKSIIAQLLVSGLAAAICKYHKCPGLTIGKGRGIKKKSADQIQVSFLLFIQQQMLLDDVTDTARQDCLSRTSLSSYELIMLVISGFLSSAGFFFYSIFLNISVLVSHHVTTIFKP